jgi:integrase
MLDYRDSFGRRHRPVFPKTPEGIRQANQELAIVMAQSRRDCAVEPDITLSEYIKRYIAWITAGARKIPPDFAPNTVKAYSSNLRLHVQTHRLAKYPVQAIDRQRASDFLDELGHRMSHTHVGNVYFALSAMLTRAMDEGLLTVNPLFRMGKGAKEKSIFTKVINTQAMEREERDRFLDTALLIAPRFHIALCTLAYAGLRIGELRGLQRSDVRSSVLRVERQVVDRLDTITGKMVRGPKGSKKGMVKRRDVDLATQLAPILRPLVVRPGRSPWLFFDAEGDPTLFETSKFTRDLNRAMERILEAAHLPSHFTLHDLRHTFATMIITQKAVRPGDLLQYLMDQLGDDSIDVVSGTYAHWIKQSDRAIVSAGAERAISPAPPDLPLTGNVVPFKKQ